MSTTPTTINTQKAWLDEGLTYATNFLTKTIETEIKRDLSPSEQKLRHIVASYCYLYHKAQEHGFLDEDKDNFFNETLH